MSGRYYSIKLSCGCLISLDGGGGLIPCFSDDFWNSQGSKCKYEEEYLLNPEWIERQVEIFRRNWYERSPTEEEIAEVRKEVEEEYKDRLEKYKTKLAQERIAKALRGER